MRIYMCHSLHWNGHPGNELVPHVGVCHFTFQDFVSTMASMDRNRRYKQVLYLFFYRFLVSGKFLAIPWHSLRELKIYNSEASTSNSALDGSMLQKTRPPKKHPSVKVKQFLDVLLSVEPNHIPGKWFPWYADDQQGVSVTKESAIFFQVTEVIQI